MRGRATLYLLISAIFLAMLGCTASANVVVTPTVVPSPSATRLQIAAASPTAMLITPTRVPSPTTPFTPQPTPPPTPTSTPFPPLPTVAPEFWASVGVSPDTLIAAQIGGDIATMRVDGTHLNQLTTYGYNSDPVLSPDRKRIAYRSVPKSITALADPGDKLQAGYYNIWVITVDGTRAWQLTNSELSRSVPVWSLDSKKVAFSEGPNSMLVEIEVDTRSRREIIPAAPRYQPNGNGIGYIMDGGGLAWVDTTGGIHTLVPTVTLPMSTTVHDFDWMSDGQHVVYTLFDESQKKLSSPWEVKYSVWIAQSDGSDPIKLMEQNSVFLNDIRVSPDGKVISIRSSGYGDVCWSGQYVDFLLLSTDGKSVQRVNVESFRGRRVFGESFFPISNITWVSARLASGRFSIACPENGDVSGAGTYLIDPVGQRVVQITH